MTEQNKIIKYNQIYDYLKTIKFVEYISDNRNKIHNQLYNNAIDKLIKEVNNPNTTYKIAKAIQAKINLYNYYQIHNILIDKPELEKTVDDYMDYEHNLKNKLVNIIDNTPDKIKLEPFNKNNFKFIEYKNKTWYTPSRVSIIYSHSLVYNDKGNYIRLIIGPYTLAELWENKYILEKDINKIIKPDNGSKFVIEYIDYVNGYCIINDKINNENITIDLDYLLNIHDYEYSHLYDQMFTIKRKTQ